MHRKSYGCALCGLSFSFVLVLSIRAALRTMIYDCEKHYQTAYSLFRCSFGRWPSSSEEILSRANPDYATDLKSQARIFQMVVTQRPSNNGEMVLHFVGSYLGHFEDSMTLRWTIEHCKDPAFTNLFFPKHAVQVVPSSGRI
jgi:hypothetical protein